MRAIRVETRRTRRGKWRVEALTELGTPRAGDTDDWNTVTNVLRHLMGATDEATAGACFTYQEWPLVFDGLPATSAFPLEFPVAFADC